jgi:alpha-1,3-rhamnosyltransferase
VEARREILKNGAPLVSIVVPAYNHERYVGAAIDSLVAQTWPNLELIIVNDGSPDATLEIIQSRRAGCEARFARYEVLDQANAGVAEALNRGIKVARGDYVYLLASDDISEPDAIATMVPILVNEVDVAVVSGDCDFIDATGAKTSRSHLGVEHTSFMRLCTSHRDDVLGDKFGSYASLLNGNYILPGLLMRRHAVHEVGSFDPNCAMEDYDLWLKLSKSYRFRFVDRVLCHYRWHGENTISQNAEGILNDELSLLVREAGHCFVNGLSELWATRTREVLAAYRSNWQHASSAQVEEVAQAYATLKTLTSEFERMRTSLLQVQSERDKATSEMDAALRERDKARRDRDTVVCSTTWRTAWPIRAVGIHLPPGLRRLLRGGVKLGWCSPTFKLRRKLRER